jgi:putative ABC transport system ATP-binding protein
MGLVEVKEVSKEYRVGEVVVSALQRISLEIDEQAFVSVVGPSGSGKTTLLNLIGCLDKPTQGLIRVAGTDITTLNRKQAASFRGKHMGFIFQDFNLLPVLTVYENIEYPLLMVQNVPPAERKKRVLDLLEAVGMTEQKDKYPDQISGGQKQRVAVARALVPNPQLVLADEPTANLDSKTAYLIIELMKSMRDQFQTTFIFSTHDPRIVGEAEVVYTLVDGKLNGQETEGGENNAKSF